MRHALFGNIGRPRKVIVLFMALAMALVAGPAGAQADDTGSGSGEGEEESIQTGRDFGTAEDPFCLEVTDSSYFVDVVGTFTATNDQGQTAVYEGPARVKYETTETYYIAPEGTYTDATMGEGCDEGTLGDPVAASVEVVESPELPSTDGSITCPRTEGEYFRLTSDVTVQWKQDCTVDGNVVDPGFAVPMDDDVPHLFTGELDAATGALVGTWEYPDPTQ